MQHTYLKLLEDQHQKTKEKTREILSLLPRPITHKGINLPKDFVKFNKIIGQPKHPESLKPTPIYDYQLDYFNAWVTHHKLILNKSRKIGATETALRIIAYLALHGVYAGHRVMIVAGNKQDIANRFVQRFKDLFTKFEDNDGKKWNYNDIISEESSKHIILFNGTHIQAYPANESVRGEENVKCVFMSECAFINRLDDTRVYNALHPNVANIADADFILESTPNGRRGFFWYNWDANSEYTKLEQPYTVSFNKLLSSQFIEKERKNPKINFEQEYECKFTTSINAVFRPEEINFVEKQINNYDDILGYK